MIKRLHFSDRTCDSRIELELVPTVVAQLSKSSSSYMLCEIQLSCSKDGLLPYAAIFTSMLRLNSFVA